MTKKVKEIVFEAKFKRSVSDWIREIVLVLSIICGSSGIICLGLIAVMLITGHLSF